MDDDARETAQQHAQTLVNAATVLDNILTIQQRVDEDIGTDRSVANMQQARDVCRAVGETMQDELDGGELADGSDETDESDDDENIRGFQ